MLYDSIYMTFLKRQSYMEKGLDRCMPGVGVAMCLTTKEQHECGFAGDETVLHPPCGYSCVHISMW